LSLSLKKYLNGWDTRFKLVSGILLIAIIAFFPPLHFLGVFYYFVLSLVFVFSSEIVPRIKTALSALIPVLILFISIPVAISLLSSGGWTSGENFLFGSMIGLKSLSIVSFMMYLFYSSPFTKILGAINRLRVPKVLVFMLMVAHRYFFLFQRTASELVHARSLRLYDRSPLRKLPSALNVLIHKALDHGEEVYIAMRLRGGDNALPLFSSFHATGRDFWISGIVMLLAVIPLIIICA